MLNVLFYFKLIENFQIKKNKLSVIEFSLDVATKCVVIPFGTKGSANAKKKKFTGAWSFQFWSTVNLSLRSLL